MILELWGETVTGWRQERSRCKSFVLLGAYAFFASLFSAGSIFAAEPSLKAMVIYPELRQPYAKVFEDIIEGIVLSFEGELIAVAVGEDRSTLFVRDDQPPDVVIALGNRGYEVASVNTPPGVPMVLAGVSDKEAIPYPGISVLPDPEVVLANLRMLAPAVTHLHVLVREEENDLYSQWIKEAAERESLKVTLHQCVNFHGCAESVRYITALNLGRSSGLWLADPGVVDNAILGIILENAWRQRFVVLSSNPSHVRRGVLFALYPNNLKMGETLGNIANQVAAGGNDIAGIEPLRDVSLAVNLRTGSRIGLVFDREIRGRIDLAFPAD